MVNCAAGQEHDHTEFARLNDERQNKSTSPSPGVPDQQLRPGNLAHLLEEVLILGGFSPTPLFCSLSLCVSLCPSLSLSLPHSPSLSPTLALPVSLSRQYSEVGPGSCPLVRQVKPSEAERAFISYNALIKWLWKVNSPIKSSTFLLSL